MGGAFKDKNTLEPSMLALMSHGRPLIPEVSACMLTMKQDAIVDTRDKHVSRTPHEAALLPVDPWQPCSDVATHGRLQVGGGEGIQMGVF